MVVPSKILQRLNLILNQLSFNFIFKDEIIKVLTVGLIDYSYNSFLKKPKRQISINKNY
jgi:hypothetical protein